MVRVRGRLSAIEGAPTLTPTDTREIIYSILSNDQRQRLETNLQIDFAYSIPGRARFRVNAYFQRAALGAAFRLIPFEISPLEQLGLPPAVAEFAKKPRGIVLVTGPTGSGKTTTLAGMIDHINSNKEVHVVTIEDPIEVLHFDKLAMVNQREVRVDTEDFVTAMRAAMRQDPDVILVGEMRDHETVKAGLAAAETGHFVMSTLHTTDAAETINRIIDFFPPHEQKQVRLALAASLRGIICQRLVPRADGEGRCVVMEIAVNTGRIADAIADADKTSTIPALIADGTYYGMQTFDQHLRLPPPQPPQPPHRGSPSTQAVHDYMITGKLVSP
jgi:twitching motility protein PilT